LVLAVSIHAPTRGATKQSFFDDAALDVSIHAPTRGATCWYLRCSCILFCFNPRAHEGRDLLSGAK